MRSCGFAFAGSSYYKMWAGLNGFDPRNDLVLGGKRIGVGFMNLVTVILRYTYGYPLVMLSQYQDTVWPSCWTNSHFLTYFQ